MMLMFKVTITLLK